MIWNALSRKKLYQHGKNLRRPKVSTVFRGVVVAALVVSVASLCISSLHSAGAAGNITFVKDIATATGSSYTAANTLTLTVPAAGVAQGNTVIIFAGSNYGNVVVSSATDTKGNTYTVDNTRSNTSNGTNTTILSAYMTTGLVGGNTINLTYSGVSQIRVALATEWNGIAPTGRVDQKATNASTGTSMSAGTIPATTQATELVVAAFSDGDTNETFTPGSGYTGLTAASVNIGGVYRKQWQQYKLVSATGTQTTPASSSAASQYAAAAVTYKALTTADTTAPSDPTNFAVTNSTGTSITTSWTASTDNVGVAGYQLFNGNTSAGIVTGTTGTFSGLACGTSYTLGVEAYDASNNRSGRTTLVAQTPGCDTTAPSVSLTSPADGSTATGSVAVSATASDNTGVVGVQFKLDGNNLLTEDTTNPYSINWDSTSATNGSHALTAVARDAAGNTTTSSPVNVTVSNSVVITTPTPFPAAGTQGLLVSSGVVEASARQVVRTSANVVYVIVADDNACQGSGGSGSIHISKGIGSQPGNPYAPTSFAEQDAAHRPIAPGTTDCTYSAASTVQSPDSRLDSTDTIHITYIEGQTGNLYYQTYSTTTDTWGPRVVIANGAKVGDGSGWPRSGQVSLTLDANNVPHIVYASSGTSNTLRYINRIGGSWSTPITVASGTDIMHPSMVTSLDGSIHLAWLNNSIAPHAEVYYSHYSSGAWSPQELVSAGDANVLANNNSDQIPNITTDTNNRPIVLFMDGVPMGNDYVRMRYRAATGVWTDNTPSGFSGASNSNGMWYAHTPQHYTSASNGNYVFLGHDVNIQFGYQYQLGGVGTNWSNYFTLDPQRNSAPASGDTCSPGTDGSASVRFDPLRDNNPGIIDVVYFDESYSDCSHHLARVFYKAIAISTPTDTTAPTVSMSAPANNVTLKGSATVSANASDNIGVSGVQFKLDGANLGAEDTTAPYSVSWNTVTASNGSHTLTAVARDAAGNTTTATSVVVTIDNSAPTVNVTAPSSGSTVAGDNVSISADATDNIGVVGVQFKLDGNNLGAEDTSAPYGLAWDSTAAINGTHSLSAVARDAIGNSTTSTTVSFTVNNIIPDTTAPTVSLNSPTDNALVTGNNVAIAATANDNIAVVGVQFKLDGNNLGSEFSSVPYALNWDSSTVSSGAHVLTAVARDAAGNTTTSAPRTVIVDGSGPSVSLTDPADLAVVSGDVQINATALDDIAVVGVQFKLDGTNLGAEDTANPYSYTWNSLTVSNGSHTLTAVARDGVGNSASVTINIEVNNPDLQSPTVDLTAPQNGNSFAGGSQVTLSANAADNIGVVGVQFKLDGNDLGTEQTTGPYSLVWDTTGQTSGNHTLTAVARDAAGNSSTATTVTVAIDNGPPTVSFTAPLESDTVSGGTYLIGADASDDLGVVGVQYKLDGVNLSSETISPYGLAWDTRVVSNGAHVLTAVARDAIGNTTTATVNITVYNAPPPDTTAPTVSITSPTANATVSGSDVQLIATASDNVAVESVYFQIDGVSYGAVCTTTPYQIAWNSLSHGNGPHTITAVATDTSGNISSATINVNVLNDVNPPSVNITSPANASTVSGTVNVNASAADDVAVANVQFKLDGANLGSADSSAPYTTSWTTTSATNGSHTLTAVATDTSGKQTTSSTITVTVNNAPVVLIGSQTVQSTSDSLASGRAEAFRINASASGTVSKMTFYVASNSAATKLIVGIYRDNANKPGTLLTTGSINAPVAGTWNTVNVTPASLTSGTRYWIAVLGTGGTLRFRDQSSSSYRSFTSSQSNLTALTTTFGVGTQFTEGNLSAYGSTQ